MLGNALDIRLAVAHGQNRRVRNDRLYAIGEGGRIGRRHRSQQRAQVGIVPGFDAARRQTCRLQLVNQRVAKRQHGPVARQITDLRRIGIDERRFGRRHLDGLLHIHSNTPSTGVRLPPR